MRRAVLIVLLGLFLPALAAAADEPPSLAAAVAEGSLPPLAERLPAEPRQDLPGWEGWSEGRYGGELVTLTRGGRDARDLFILGYARLVVWDENLELQPDILKSVEIEEGRRFTLTLREGHRWSDGQPFTTEDFRFWWEEVANNRELSPAGPPAELVVEGEPPLVETLSPTEVRYSWSQPNNLFLPALADTDALLLYRPAHVLKAFHPAYADQAELEAEAQAQGLPSWPALFERRDRLFRMDDPTLPTLQPWRLSSQSNSDRWVAERNPYFHRVDGQGRQLPYIDRVVIDRTEAGLIAAKVIAGESDLQARGLSFQDAALLKQAENEGKLRLLLWPIGRGAQLALYPNLNAADPRWRDLMQDRDFRRALSLALDREEIRDVIYQGFGITGNNYLLPESPLFVVEQRALYATQDLDQAAALLDGLGLTRGEDGWRRFPGGEELTLVIESGEADPAERDILVLVIEQLAEVGVKAVVSSSGRQNFRNRIQSGQAMMSIFYGLSNGLATPDHSPAELAPSSDRQNNWPLWGLHYASGETEGVPPSLFHAQRLLHLYKNWITTERLKDVYWEEMLRLHAEQVFSIGLAAGAPQPVAISPDLRNIPQQAPYLYAPGAYFGRFRPDTWWFEAN